ncbi:sodium:proton antiporter [candidate division NPL-UPA2 bacterium]|nr:sodium:proton antiporter [candidate division NPL-UPA2 bacterium]
MLYALCLLLFVVGLYGVVTKKNVIKIVISLVIMGYAVNLFLIMLGYREKGVAPIIDQTTEAAKFAQTSVDPLPQALVLTAIVIGLGVTALMVAICIRLYERYGTFDITEMRKLKG